MGLIANPFFRRGITSLGSIFTPLGCMICFEGTGASPNLKHE